MEYFIQFCLIRLCPKIRVVENSEEMSLEDVLKTDAASMKDLLKKKWKEVNGNGD